ncbi:MAG: fibronectin type III domain-containing protein, partial [Candidatus Dojkabacteria bacterium]|nr:fibronectin type III domain-containing protein [Candidatus Dojkabacteria bacterium]
MNFKLIKILRTIAKIILILVGICIVGYVGLMVYKSVAYKPMKVRVTNVTDSSFTVSWVTDEPIKGIVYYKESKSPITGPLGWLGAKVAYDDRDYSNAQSMCVEEFNKSVTPDDTFSIDNSGFDCEDISVTSRGKYYTHHVTVMNLDSEKEYFFVVGNGIWSWDIDGVSKEVGEKEMALADTFSVKTAVTLDEMPTPNVAYGKVYAMLRNEDGFLEEDISKDSLIFSTVSINDTESLILSTVTNSEGGYTFDKANFRNSDGSLIEDLSNGVLKICTQYEDVIPKGCVTEDSNLDRDTIIDILGNTEEDLKEVKNNILDMLIGEVEAAPISDALLVGTSCGDGGTYGASVPGGCEIGDCYNPCVKNGVLLFNTKDPLGTCTRPVSCANLTTRDEVVVNGRLVGLSQTTLLPSKGSNATLEIPKSPDGDWGSTLEQEYIDCYKKDNNYYWSGGECKERTSMQIVVEEVVEEGDEELACTTGNKVFTYYGGITCQCDSNGDKAIFKDPRSNTDKSVNGECPGGYFSESADEEIPSNVIPAQRLSSIDEYNQVINSIENRGINCYSVLDEPSYYQFLTTDEAQAFAKEGISTVGHDNPFDCLPTLDDYYGEGESIHEDEFNQLATMDCIYRQTDSRDLIVSLCINPPEGNIRVVGSTLALNVEEVVENSTLNSDYVISGEQFGNLRANNGTFVMCRKADGSIRETPKRLDTGTGCPQGEKVASIEETLKEGSLFMCIRGDDIKLFEMDGSDDESSYCVNSMDTHLFEALNFSNKDIKLKEEYKCSDGEIMCSDNKKYTIEEATVEYEGRTGTIENRDFGDLKMCPGNTYIIECNDSISTSQITKPSNSIKSNTTSITNKVYASDVLGTTDTNDMTQYKIHLDNTGFWEIGGTDTYVESEEDMYVYIDING